MPTTPIIRPATRRLQIPGPGRQRAQARPQRGDQLDEDERHGAADQAERGVGEQLGADAPDDTAVHETAARRPRNHCSVTTLATAGSTTAPRTPAVQRPMTSSMTNSTAVIGALNAAARPAAAPIGAM